MTALLFDFRDPLTANDWAAIDDRVMGGISRSRLRHDPKGHAVFEGEVSLERNGGFASVRSSPGERGKPGAEACVIEIGQVGLMIAAGQAGHFALDITRISLA
ncbi:MAG: CIA30 family protein [Rubrivivax sp.]|nr:CIA30 family protein [Rubrivivax sp.]